MALTILFFLYYLSSTALSASIITHLPGFQGPLPFYLETGYVSVDEENGLELFYYFIESERNPSEDPLLLWLTGGPGCSAFSGLVFEIGPLKFVTAEYNGSLPNLVYHPYSWTKVASIIFLDSPVGTGFSFSRKPEGYATGDIAWSMHAYKFLRKWFVDHAKFLSNPLYISGDSYAGKVVPVVTKAISEDIEAEQQPSLNLKGYLIGNPATGLKIDMNARVPYAHGVGIISDVLYELIQRNCEGEDYEKPVRAQCATDLDAFDKFYSETQATQILEPKCARASPKPEEMIGDRRSLKGYIELHSPPPRPALKCRSYAYFLSYYWANSNVTRKALHIKKGTVREWQRCNLDLPYTKDIPNNINYHLSITSKGYRALVYSGDHDLVVPFLGTQAWTRSLNFSVVDEWRSWHVGGHIAGYTTTYSNNLTFATVRGAGHTAPEYKPEECFAMVQRWISSRPL
ncbi:serine carboxypeptidase-like 18 isoform X1 [Phoenix dactylifera]|uniref:Serine carboxypeptidase-like 18 isoform X1 n=1 Tax=Phoenix dactylifera TaxID=42345 RepID=A0A8B9A1P4_PHODC|nr:serine carboxypeptidase-like 18 isoform X1 [Phoenix dactylifera]